MMHRFVSILALAGAGALLPLGMEKPAQAISFYLGNGVALPQAASSFSFSQSGISLTATARLDNGNSRNVYQSILGLGATRNILLDGDRNQLDGVGNKEILKLDFTPKVVLKSATFSRVGNNDDFTLKVDGNQFITADIPGGNILDLDVSTFTFNASPTGKIFEFSVKEANDDYLLKAVDVEAVPEPLTLLGSAGALGFGLHLKRKFSARKKQIS